MLHERCWKKNHIRKTLSQPLLHVERIDVTYSNERQEGERERKKNTDDRKQTLR